jgi:hypothetical protein
MHAFLTFLFLSLSYQCHAEFRKHCRNIENWKCVRNRGAISWGLFRPLPMKEIELWSNTIWDSGPRLEIFLEFWPKDWSTFGLGLEPFSSTVEGFCIWNLWSS